MTTMTAPEPTQTAAIQAELDQARRSGPLQQIVIPPCPELLSRLRAAMAQTEPDLNEIARIAASDVAMSATLIRSSNGPLFAAGQPVQTVGQAMNRLGLEHTASVMAGFLMQRAIRVNHKLLERFWERSTKRALAMAFIAKKLPGLSPDLAHTYGLFSHVGMPVMMQSVKGYAGTVIEARARIDRSPIATENANHRTDHAVVGALVARVWRLAPSVVAAIRLHHDLELLGGRGAESEVQTLVAAGLVAEHLMRRHEAQEPDVDWLKHGQSAMDWLHVNGDDLLFWEEELQETLDEA
ncbi:MAG TPA: HDOD domain-containing protein [Candidatus Aquabacterium excrementipullorum]|nr:HDOD domain-containing protein [Candidatus Aquabacterium excrementipullorum]